MPAHMSGWLEQAWLARYLDRQLTGEEAVWFEAYVLDKPELLDVIDADTRLRDALAADRPVLASNDTSEASSAQSLSFPRKRESSAFTVEKNNRPTWLALAASLLLGLGVGGISVRSLAPNHSADIVASPTRIIYDTMRGEATPPRIEHADSNSTYVLVEVAVPPGANNIVLHVDGTQDRSLSVSPDGFVSFLARRDEWNATHQKLIEYGSSEKNGTTRISLSGEQRGR